MSTTSTRFEITVARPTLTAWISNDDIVAYLLRAGWEVQPKVGLHPGWTHYRRGENGIDLGPDAWAQEGYLHRQDVEFLAQCEGRSPAEVLRDIVDRTPRAPVASPAPVWSHSLARRFVDDMADDLDESSANDCSEEARRLRAVTAADLAHPATLRAFVRGAVGGEAADPAKSEHLMRFAAVCAGDAAAYDRLQTRHRAFLAAAPSSYEQRRLSVQAEDESAAFASRDADGSITRMMEAEAGSAAWQPLLVNDDPLEFNVHDEAGPTRPAGTRHEIHQEGDTAVIREVWYYSDTGELYEVREVRMGLNNLVHLVVNTTAAERAYFTDTRTAAPEIDWAGVPTMGVERLRVALQEVAELGPRCEACEENEVATTDRGPVTHQTKLWGADVYLCAEHAPARAASHAKAESKGSGVQPPVVPYAETNQAVLVAQRALAEVPAAPLTVDERRELVDARAEVKRLQALLDAERAQIADERLERAEAADRRDD